LELELESALEPPSKSLPLPIRQALSSFDSISPSTTWNSSQKQKDEKKVVNHKKKKKREKVAYEIE
jgi:hypothetical protein